MRLFLGDLVHTWSKISVWTMPLNIAFVSGYANQQLGGCLDVRLFKRPERMIEDIRAEKPDIVALSYYVWNINLNKLVARVAREANPNVLLVGGGPIFTAANANTGSATHFFASHPLIDAFVLNQGERPFLELVGRFRESGGDRLALRRQAIPGCLVNDLNRGEVRAGPELDALKDLNNIPSPYLSGQLDEFFSEPISPIIETNRSCPYRCTFCAWGIGTTKLAQFDTQRVLDEIDYIAERQPQSATWFVADANFSVLERDEMFARRFAENSEQYGSPQHVAAQWNKSRPDRVYRVAQHLRKISQIGASMQSLHEPTLKAIKRRNLSLQQVSDMTEALNRNGANIRLFSELIVPLPEETFATHIDANRQLIDLGAEVFNYNLHILPGTEMDTPECRGTYFKNTGYRLHDNAFGIYDGQKVFESQEVVLETPTMSREEVSSLRFIHFLLQYMWVRKYHYDYLSYLQAHGVHPTEAVIRIHRAMKAGTGKIKALFDDFYRLYNFESFPTSDSLISHWSKPKHFQMLSQGDYGKLNALFTFKIERECLKDFSDFLGNLAEELIDTEKRKPELIRAEVKELLRFSIENRVEFSGHDFLREKVRPFTYDFVGWRRDGRPPNLNNYRGTADQETLFSLTSLQEATLQRLLKQFASHNVNLTMRKMTEYSRPETFFYQLQNELIADDACARLPL